jgi:hypothetical protein
MPIFDSGHPVVLYQKSWYIITSTNTTLIIKQQGFQLIIWYMFRLYNSHHQANVEQRYVHKVRTQSDPISSTTVSFTFIK